MNLLGIFYLLIKNIYGHNLNMSKVKIVLDYIYNKAPLQRKKIASFMECKDKVFMDEFESFLTIYINYLDKHKLTIDYAIDSYLIMVNDMFKSHIKFMRKGTYPVSKTSHAIKNVYKNKNKMLSYMVGLALSQYLWSTHYEMFVHLKKSLKDNRRNINKYLEIGPGHGLFLKNAIEILEDNVEMKAIDISPISLDISKSIISHFYPERKVEFVNKDMLDLNLDTTYDFIVMGEVLEHVENPQLLLRKIKKLLRENGKAFISTCVDCPAIDHIWHFHTIQEIQDMLYDCGLIIKSEKILPVEDLPMTEIVKNKITINYSVIVAKD
jgi:ubiquinone/menaquinone biosynthesis C-methylase UbiE